ncbi:anaerobic ribonucleoside-triphosphate reductase activating protein [Massilimicrobiota sp. An134]|uniref:anaerobic ribonucleoside-triphosphate reductase activating protein n=1 Tax=Massilimicrobiota sp. An134 TaxID=1965557 RepID=UPI000B397D4E|nr:anaerobic ribonucleoside-triphosphate reductase activating protein [Massilimicrobiota sp. An134]OUQ25530.1 anaerobic ribonucleoside-triphosphate reductase activating protein [Massilimicrobiota sp. An134]
MKYATIKTVDIANGTGVRVSLFVSGCTHRCPECFNEIAWDFNYGQEFNQETIDLILKALEPSHIAGLTLLGGEPMELVNQEGLLPLLQQVRKMYPDKDIWCYTGYLYEDLLPGGKVHGPYSDEILSYLDILVDGPFILAQKNISLKFRGSENQRIIDVKRTNQSRQIVLWDEK